MADNMQLVITANVAQSTTALNQTQKALAATAATALKTDSSLQKLSTGSNQAGNALQNLGRVVQDAPFGFIGIQNNINPLLESFQRLKVETGSTGGAFKALAASLVGGAGIGLAVSLATSALTLLAQNGFFKAGKEANIAAEQAKKFKEAIAGIREDTAKEQAQVLILVSALEKETTSRKDKLGAIKELQSINPKYFGDLRLENELVVGLTSAYANYKNAIIASIQNKIDSKQLETVLETINKLEEQQLNNQFRIKQVEQDRRRLQGAGADPSLVKTLDTQIQLLGESNKLNQLYKQRDEILKKIADRNFEGQIKQELDKTKKAAETVNDVLVKLAREIDFLNTKEITLGTNETKAKVSAIESAIERLVKGFKIDPKDTIIQKLFGDIQSLNFSQFQKDINAQARKLRLEPIEIPVELKIDIGKFDPFPNRDLPIFGLKSKDDAFKFLDDLNARVKLTQQVFTDVFYSIGEGIGKSVSDGTNILKGVFEGLLHVMGAFLVKMGESAIQASVLAIALKNIFKNPLTGLIAGIAAVAIGTILQNIQLPAFANGVENFGGGMAIVGERGPEIVRLPRGSDVIPNHQLGGVSQGSPIIMIADSRISGNDIVVSYRRSSKTISQNG